MITTSNFSPVLKERYKNPLVSRMLTKLKRNNKPKWRTVRTHVKARRRQRIPLVSETS